MRKKHLSPFFMFLFVLLAALFVFGCGGGNENGTPDNGSGNDNGTTEEPAGNGEALLELDNWKVPTTHTELIATFSEYRLRLNAGGEQSYHYRYLGSEAVDGVDTDKVSIAVDDEEVTLWVAADGTVKQMEMDGETFDADMAKILGEGYLSVIALPFLMADGYNIHEYVSTPGFSVKLVDSSRRSAGSLSGTIHTVEMKIGPPYTTSELTYLSRIIDLGDLQTMLGFSVTSEDGKIEFEFEIEELKLR